MDEIEAFLKNIQEGWEACDPDGEVDFHVPELLSLVRVYRNELFSYSSGDELSVLEEKAKEIINGYPRRYNQASAGDS